MVERQRKGIAILGSTGSIGQSTLQVIERYPERFNVLALAGGQNLDKLTAQILQFRPVLASTASEDGAKIVRENVRGKVQVEMLHGDDGLTAVATHPDVQMVVAALVGAVGLLPALEAIKAGKDLALANKETLVMAGQFVMDTAKNRGVRIMPVDSEHSAIFQAIQGHRKEDVRRLILTASGGAFFELPRERLEEVTPAQALMHPTWKMGQKVTVDSASLMNKALEIIEARWLFDIPQSKIQVHIHPQSIVHSMVEFIDGSVIAQMGVPDMQVPISYALAFPERVKTGLPPLNLFNAGPLTFLDPQRDQFPALDLAYEALREGGCMPAVLNGANEESVWAFLKGQIRFTRIVEVVREVMERQRGACAGGDLGTILEADQHARFTARNLIEQGFHQ
jgi:1-deoxy-D-xylulose-5-phosphate reductoisomerase